VKRRGRPPLDPSGAAVSVHVRLSPRLIDALHTRARQDRSTLTALVRRALEARHFVALKLPPP
jgi:hypothetical protein